MVRFLVSTAVYMAAAAIGLVVADVVLDDFELNYPVGFLGVVVVFGLVQAILQPLFQSITEKNADVLTGAVGIISALVALLVTEQLSDALRITGLSTWFLAALVIWLASMIAAFVLKLTVAKRVIREIRD